jgi:16S rRNA (cytosine1402-N4)-methyltransferase
MTFKASPEEGDVTAETVLNQWGEESIAAILQGFGEERFARSIAKAIVTARESGPLRRTGQLVEVIHQATPLRYQHGRTHFATRTFQALRMAVNDELGAIEAGIRGVLPFVASGGRIAVISFHSIEDRVVKHLFRTLYKDWQVLPVTKKPIVPSASEVEANPRSRSAKLRVVEKV